MKNRCCIQYDVFDKDNSTVSVVGYSACGVVSRAADEFASLLSVGAFAEREVM